VVKQISLDAWQIQHLSDLLEKGSNIVARTNKPIVLYRQTLEEEDESYEEIVCTLTKGYVIEQMVTSGGILVPSFHQQFVFTIEEYPQELLRKSKDRFLEMVDFLDEQLR
jgi:translation elongation factor EF-G